MNYALKHIRNYCEMKLHHSENMRNNSKRDGLSIPELAWNHQCIAYQEVIKEIDFSLQKSYPINNTNTTGG